MHKSGWLLSATVAIVLTGVLALGSASAAPSANAGARADGGSSALTKPAARKALCHTKRYKRAKVCRHDSYRKRLLWHKRHRKHHRGRADPRTAPCVPQSQLSFAVKAKAKLVLNGGQVCVMREPLNYSSGYQLQGFYLIGISRCVIMNSAPGSPFSTVLSLGKASQFCSKEGRGWWYVILY